MTVVVERSFSEPVEFGTIQAIEDAAARCLQAHGVVSLVSYFSTDRRRMICVYDAPDAESVRVAQRTAGVPFEAAWPARLVRLGEVERPDRLVVVERNLDPGMDEASVECTARAGATCLEDHGCRFVASYLAADGRRTVCVFEGPDAESVRTVQHRMRVPFEAAWPSTLHEGPADGGLTARIPGAT